ncbi:MAG: hypothetical protein M0R66_02200 [Candidatus Omnitrophica bacterium]|jgi:hypothetical protein|nr:hypothetical protein [Sphaerochaeta sp.]MCK9603180.1 hypothetical protein [Candidatus Omnitrophota bacterium]
MTDEYTPDTAEVKAAYGFWSDYRVGFTGSTDRASQEFNRWLRGVQCKAYDEGSAATFAYIEHGGKITYDSPDNPYEEEVTP